MDISEYEKQTVAESEVTGESDGTILHYTSYDNKVVPGDYQMTEQDKADQESGKVVFSFGSAEIYTQTVQNLSFSMNGVNYTLTTLEGSLSEQDFVDAAEKIILAGK